MKISDIRSFWIILTEINLATGCSGKIVFVLNPLQPIHCLCIAARDLQISQESMNVQSIILFGHWWMTIIATQIAGAVEVENYNLFFEKHVFTWTSISLLYHDD